MDHEQHPAPRIVRVFHADHSVSTATLEWALAEIGPVGFFLHTLTLPEAHPDLLSALYGPRAGDAPIAEERVCYRQRSADRPPSRMLALPARPSRLLTVIGLAAPEGVTIYTAYGGPAAEREPGDPTAPPGSPEHDAAAAFWAEHALASVLS